jgi:hypothetical protein
MSAYDDVRLQKLRLDTLHNSAGLVYTDEKAKENFVS